jgi:hypothetical protein
MLTGRIGGRKMRKGQRDGAKCSTLLKKAVHFETLSREPGGGTHDEGNPEIL